MRPGGRSEDGLEASEAAAAAAVVPGVAGVGGTAAVGEAVPPLGVVEAVHGPAGRPVLAAFTAFTDGMES